jgi:hypothetical protein
MASKCICETLYDQCVEQIESSLKKKGSVIIDRLDNNNPCNNKMIQHMVTPLLQSYNDPPEYRVKVRVHTECIFALDKKTIVDRVVLIAISDKRVFG